MAHSLRSLANYIFQRYLKFVAYISSAHMALAWTKKVKFIEVGTMKGSVKYQNKL